MQANRLAALDATEKLRQASLALVTARGELRGCWGCRRATPLRLATRRGAAARGARSGAAARGSRVARRFDLGALRQGYGAQEAAVRLAVLNQFPTLSLGVTGTRDTGGNKLVRRRGQLDAAAVEPRARRHCGRQATRAALKAEYEARLFQTRAEIAAAAAGIAVAERTVGRARAAARAVADIMRTRARARRRAAISRAASR